MSIKSSDGKGFTIVELIIVIVVIGILAAVGYASFSQVQERARVARIKAEASTMKEAIEIARNKTHKSLAQLTGSYWTGQYCLFQSGTGTPGNGADPGTPMADGVDFSVQNSTTQRCWNDYLNAMQVISDASGIDITGFRDPWGRPYYIDENEQDYGTYACSSDVLRWLSYPYKGGFNQDWSLDIPVLAYKHTCYT